MTRTHEADLYGHRLTTTAAAADAYRRGTGRLLRVSAGALADFAEAVQHDPTFALGHSALALVGHEFDAPVDVAGHLRTAREQVARGDDRERSHVYAVGRLVEGDGGALLRHLREYPTDAMLLAVAVPTIAFSGVTTVPAESWSIVESVAPAYGSDWWFDGLLAFIRQEQRRFDEAMWLAERSLDRVPDAGQAAHARTHVHYETGDHANGLDWLDRWIRTAGQDADNRAHYSWHAALHELALGDVAAVRRRYDAQLAPHTVTGCRALVDSASLLWRWSLTSGADQVPAVAEVRAVVSGDLLRQPPTTFMALHAAVALCADRDADGLDRLRGWAATQPDPTFGEVVAPLADALRALVEDRPGDAADGLLRMRDDVVRMGGSDAQREVVEDTCIAALLAAGRLDEARALLDRRLDRRDAPRDLAWRDRTLVAE